MSLEKLDPISLFEAEKQKSIAAYRENWGWRKTSNDWLKCAFEQRYMYNFSCLGRPIIQTPVDMVAMQELIWSIKPDFIIETGIAHGGSLVLSASMLALIDYCDAVMQGKTLDPQKSRRRVLGIDIDIRSHNRAAIEAHPMSHMIEMIEGPSTAPGTIAKVKDKALECSKILVCLDSNHTHEHVLAELEAYAPLTSEGSYCVVFDTIVEDMPDGLFPDRPWCKGNNPKTAVREYLAKIKTARHIAADGNILKFEVDEMIDSKLLLSVAPEGYLRRVPGQ